MKKMITLTLRILLFFAGVQYIQTSAFAVEDIVKQTNPVISVDIVRNF